jgi:ubiquinol-cytochrome c reductase cytochrome b subunit
MAAFSAFIFWWPNAFSDPTNFVPANPLLTPEDIQPEWYFLPFYAILRAVPDKLGGVSLMFAAVAVLFVLPWLDTSKVRSCRFRPIARVLFWVWILSIVVLGVVGAHKPEGVWVLVGRGGTIVYFAYLVILLPLLGFIEKPLPLPESISVNVLPVRRAA